MSSAKPQKSRLGRGLNSLISVDLTEIEKQVAESEADVQRALAEMEQEQPESDLATFGQTDEGPAASAGTGSATSAPPASVLVRDLAVSDIDANPHQPRRQWDEASMKALAESIRADGLLQPILVRPAGNRFELIAGERRLRAAILAGLQEVPAIIKEADSDRQAILALIENIHRDDLHPLDRAAAYKALMDRMNIGQLELSDRLQEDRSGVANYVRLLDLAASVQQLFRDGKLNLGHAKLLAGVTDILLQTKLATLSVDQGWSVRQLEAQINATPIAPKEKERPPVAAHIAELEKSLSGQLGMRIGIKNGRLGAGRLTIHYGSLDQFDELVNRLGLKVES